MKKNIVLLISFICLPDLVYGSSGLSKTETVEEAVSSVQVRDIENLGETMDAIGSFMEDVGGAVEEAGDDKKEADNTVETAGKHMSTAGKICKLLGSLCHRKKE